MVLSLYIQDNGKELILDNLRRFGNGLNKYEKKNGRNTYVSR